MNPLDESAEMLDARGLTCPEPIMLLHRALRRLPAGGLVELIATDPSTERDVRQLCEFLGHKLRSSSANTDEWRFLIAKRDG